MPKIITSNVEWHSYKKETGQSHLYMYARPGTSNSFDYVPKTDTKTIPAHYEADSSSLNFSNIERYKLVQKLPPERLKTLQETHRLGCGILITNDGYNAAIKIPSQNQSYWVATIISLDEIVNSYSLDFSQKNEFIGKNFNKLVFIFKNPENDIKIILEETICDKLQGISAIGLAHLKINGEKHLFDPGKLTNFNIEHLENATLVPLKFGDYKAIRKENITKVNTNNFPLKTLTPENESEGISSGNDEIKVHQIVSMSSGAYEQMSNEIISDFVSSPKHNDETKQQTTPSARPTYEISETKRKRVKKRKNCIVV